MYGTGCKAHFIPEKLMVEMGNNGRQHLVINPMLNNKIRYNLASHKFQRFTSQIIFNQSISPLADSSTQNWFFNICLISSV